MNWKNRILNVDVLDGLKMLPDDSIDCIVTSPPYWGLRDYGVEGQIGLEPTLEEYLEKMLKVTAELKRVLKPTGVMFWNHGDCWSSRVKKSLCMQNFRLAMRMVDEQGWVLRNIIIWHKPNHMPESVKDRFAKSYEPVFMFVKKKKYWFDLDAVREPHTWAKKDKRSKLRRVKHKTGKTASENNQYGMDATGYHPLGKNPGDVWSIPTQPFSARKLDFEDVDHFATFPPRLVERMIKASCPQKGIVLDPFMGSGTTALVALQQGKNFVGFELNPDYVKIAEKRIEPLLKQKRLWEVSEK